MKFLPRMRPLAAAILLGMVTRYLFGGFPLWLWSVYALALVLVFAGERAGSWRALLAAISVLALAANVSPALPSHIPPTAGLFLLATGWSALFALTIPWILIGEHDAGKRGDEENERDAL